MTSSFLFRTRIVLSAVILFGFILVAKLFLVQVIHSNTYAEKAEHQYATPSGDIFERGTIYFSKRDGTLSSAATQIAGYKLAINPSKIVEPESVYEKLSKFVPLTQDEFMFRVGKVNDPYEEIANHLSKEQADSISALKISGVSIFKEKWRFYPSQDSASHVLGLVGYKGDELGGRYGLEKQFDSYLTRNDNNPYVNFFAEVFSNVNRRLFEDDKERAGDIVTTIEPEVQDFLENKLAEVKAKYFIDSIGGIIMNPKDGSIYALSSLPDFNPNDFSGVSDPKVFSNPFVENVLEFGSVVKPLVMAGAIDRGVVTAKTTYNDKGSVIVEKKEIFNFDKKGRGPNTSMQDVLNQSLNTGMVFVEQKLGRQNLKDYLMSFGIKDKTGIDLPNETSGLVSNLNSPREIEYANAAFGQGIALTPIEMVRALASLGNGGNLVVPHVVSRIKYSDGTSKEFTYPITPTKISKQTSEEITRMLVGVMDTSLKGGLAKFEHFSVAIKTGTAQVANNTTGGYYEDRHTHSFFGYFPAYNPEFIVFLYAINPKGVLYAANTWADPFLDLTKFLLNYYEIAPDR
jgi:stage V sporulation protein D (sporulation-specific penicillin-binding protein)